MLRRGGPHRDLRVPADRLRTQGVSSDSSEVGTRLVGRKLSCSMGSRVPSGVMHSRAVWRFKALVWALLVPACAASHPAVKSKELAAEAFSCPLEQVDVHHHGWFALAHGCGKRALYQCGSRHVGVVECWLSKTGAGIVEVVPRVLQKASALLGCDSKQLSVDACGLEGMYHVAGCGRVVEYECISQDDCCALTTPGVRADTALNHTCSIGGGGEPKVACDGEESCIRTNHTQFVPAVRACYARVLKNQPVVGLVHITVKVDAAGSVREVTTLVSSVGHPELEACVADAFRHERFQAPEPGEFFLSVPFVFNTAPPWGACR